VQCLPTGFAAGFANDPALSKTMSKTCAVRKQLSINRAEQM
jgi:hypothetical protein